MILTGDTSNGLGLISGLRGKTRATKPLSHSTASWEDEGRDVSFYDARLIA